MNLNSLILTKNNCYKAGAKLTPRGIMVHSTGADNPNLKRYVGPDDGRLGVNTYNNHWNQATPGGKSVCVHAFIGKLADGSIATYQTLPWDMRAWHGGKGRNGSVNDTHSSFEICEDNLSDSVYFNAVYQEAAELCAYLCKRFGLDPLGDGVIIGHYEGYARGIATNHNDPGHWFQRHGKSMDTFRDYVKQLTAGEVPAVPESAPPADFQPYTVRVTADALNYRAGPGTGYAVRGTIRDRGVYTIVEEADGAGASKWGKLRSGVGWVSLDYVERR